MWHPARRNSETMLANKMPLNLICQTPFLIYLESLKNAAINECILENGGLRDFFIKSPQ
jgi:hypothetical protein